jgi:hypothetical protein
VRVAGVTLWSFRTEDILNAERATMLDSGLPIESTVAPAGGGPNKGKMSCCLSLARFSACLDARFNAANGSVRSGPSHSQRTTVVSYRTAEEPTKSIATDGAYNKEYPQSRAVSRLRCIAAFLAARSPSVRHAEVGRSFERGPSGRKLRNLPPSAAAGRRRIF